MTNSIGGHKLSDWLPREAWWLIYINRADHDKALKSEGSPADYYDGDQSPGYRAGIEAAFEQLFEQTGRLETLTADFYRALHDLAISKLTGETELVEEWSTGDPEQLVTRGQKSAGSVRFPMTHPSGSRPIAADLSSERLSLPETGQTVHVLTEPDFDHDLDGAKRMRESMQGKDKDLYACLYNVDPGMISVNYRREMAPRLVDAVGARFAKELAEASTTRQQLAAIVRTIRTLHVLHLFTNANGRLNITLLLTKLLLDQGLSPVVLTNQDDLFSGSYSVAEMVNEIEREQVALKSIVSEELARQEREGKVKLLPVSAPKSKVTAVSKHAEGCLVQ